MVPIRSSDSYGLFANDRTLRYGSDHVNGKVDHHVVRRARHGRDAGAKHLVRPQARGGPLGRLLLALPARPALLRAETARGAGLLDVEVGVRRADAGRPTRSPYEGRERAERLAGRAHHGAAARCATSPSSSSSSASSPSRRTCSNLAREQILQHQDRIEVYESMQARFSERDEVADRMVPLQLGLELEYAALKFWARARRRNVARPFGRSRAPPAPSTLTLDTARRPFYVSIIQTIRSLSDCTSSFRGDP